MKILTALTLVLVPAVAFAAGGGHSSKYKPATLEKIEGSDLKRVVLTEKAAERTGIQSVAVREDTVSRKWLVGGIVTPSPVMKMATQTEDKMAQTAMASGNEASAMTSSRNNGSLSGGLLVRVAVSPSELQSVATDQPARILPLTRVGKGKASWLTATPADKMPPSGDAAQATLSYAVAGMEHGLAAGQRVSVELPRKGAGKPQKIVPYSSVLYDVHGNTWVYTNPEPLKFVRHAIKVDFIEGDIAVLTDGPAVGTKVVSTGAPELYGAETGIKK